MQINRNMSAVIANNQLLGIEERLSASIERLSSGLKINRASDNPAGMAISNKMKAQIDALDQAEANAADGVSVVQIADGALNEVSSILQRIRELSVQAANGINSFDDRKSMQDEVDELVKEVDRISTDTEYNTKKLLGFYSFSGKLQQCFCFSAILQLYYNCKNSIDYIKNPWYNQCIAGNKSFRRQTKSIRCDERKGACRMKEP